jgi:hypothetical protein
MRYNIILRRAIVAFVCAGAALTSASSSVQATSMSAQLTASRDGTCDKGEFCYYYNSGHKGSISDFSDSLGNYGPPSRAATSFKAPGTARAPASRTTPRRLGTAPLVR